MRSWGSATTAYLSSARMINSYVRHAVRFVVESTLGFVPAEEIIASMRISTLVQSVEKPYVRIV